MCVAGLNVCAAGLHRWYELIRACDPANNLQNCPERLKLEGWEKRNEYCPYCHGRNYHQSTHRLFGSTSSASSVASSPTISDMGFGRTNRRGSAGTITATLGPLSRTSSNCSAELDRATRARDMNDRIYAYLSSEPHEVLPSARKNYPTYATAIARAEEASANSSESSTNWKLPRRQSFTPITRGWRRVSQRFTVSSDLFKMV